jgi:uncharacterized protein
VTAPATTRCPTCRRAATKAGNKLYPFCSERCQMADLGRWLAGDYRIPSEEEVPRDLDPAARGDDDKS